MSSQSRRQKLSLERNYRKVCLIYGRKLNRSDASDLRFHERRRRVGCQVLQKLINYCVKQDQNTVANQAAKGQAGKPIVRFWNSPASRRAEIVVTFRSKYAFQIPVYCPYLTKVVADWPTKHEKGALTLFTAPAYCKTKGKIC